MPDTKIAFIKNERGIVVYACSVNPTHSWALGDIASRMLPGDTLTLVDNERLTDREKTALEIEAREQAAAETAAAAAAAAAAND